MPSRLVLMISLLINAAFMFVVVVPTRARNVRFRKAVESYFFGPFFAYSVAAAALILQSFALGRQFPLGITVKVSDACHAIALSALLLPLSFTLVYSTFLAWLIAIHRPDGPSRRRRASGRAPAQASLPHEPANLVA
jgi:hypothetical protein